MHIGYVPGHSEGSGSGGGDGVCSGSCSGSRSGGGSGTYILVICIYIGSLDGAPASRHGDSPALGTMYYACMFAFT